MNLRYRTFKEKYECLKNSESNSSDVDRSTCIIAQYTSSTSVKGYKVISIIQLQLPQPNFLWYPLYLRLYGYHIIKIDATSLNICIMDLPIMLYILHKRDFNVALASFLTSKPGFIDEQKKQTAYF